MAAETVVRGFIDGYLGQSELLGVRKKSARALEAMNRWVHTIGRSNADLQGMACTLTALILWGRQAHIVHVGDSRLYRLRHDRLDLLTTDHTFTEWGMQGGPSAGPSGQVTVFRSIISPSLCKFTIGIFCARTESMGSCLTGSSGTNSPGEPHRRRRLGP